MPSTYVHLAGKDVDEKLIRVYTGEPINPAHPEFSPKCSALAATRKTPPECTFAEIAERR